MWFSGKVPSSDLPGFEVFPGGGYAHFGKAGNYQIVVSMGSNNNFWTHTKLPIHLPYAILKHFSTHVFQSTPLRCALGIFVVALSLCCSAIGFRQPQVVWHSLLVPSLLLMVQKSQGQPPGMVIKTMVNNGDFNYQPPSTGDHRISEPSTVLGP